MRAVMGPSADPERLADGTPQPVRQHPARNRASVRAFPVDVVNALTGGNDADRTQAGRYGRRIEPL
jgi:hypothetical protein